MVLPQVRTKMDETYASLRVDGREDEIPSPEYPKNEWETYPLSLGSGFSQHPQDLMCVFTVAPVKHIAPCVASLKAFVCACVYICACVRVLCVCGCLFACLFLCFIDWLVG